MSGAGANKPFAEVIGDPIAHSKSPVIHNFWLDRLGIDAAYRVCHVRPDDLEAYFTARRDDPDWRGCNVTIPHKQAVQPFLDELDEKAGAIGAVNTVFGRGDGGLIGTNTDIDGVAEAIAAAQSKAANAVVIGAGGAARAAFAELARGNWADVCVIARSPEKAARATAECGLEARIVPFAESGDALQGARLLINATQLGMTGQEPMASSIMENLRRMDGNALVFDMVYAPLETELLEAARALGLRSSDGLSMLIGQAATAFTRFFGESPPRQFDEILRARLVSA